MAGLRALALALALALSCLGAAAAHAGRPSDPPPDSPRTAVVLSPADLAGPGGGVAGRTERGQVLRLLGREPGRLLVRGPEGGPARLPAEAAAVVAGPPEAHRPRIARILRSGLPRPVADRLLAGRIQKGDHMFQVEMAWGRPDRSFMVNYFSDEQHFVYLTPGGPVLLRLQAGRLGHEPPAPTLGRAGAVERPSGPR